MNDLLPVNNRIPLSDGGRPLVVGSIATPAALAAIRPGELGNSCDLLEIRLDGLIAAGEIPSPPAWAHLSDHPLLFTARRSEEGGLIDWGAEQRMKALQAALPDAACIDIEAASIDVMGAVLAIAKETGTPWIASFHDFSGMPDERTLRAALDRAILAGASVFKWAASLHCPADLARMAEFQNHDHGIPVASMGMGPLATVSRLLCAQYGSVLNYGYLGEKPTAPGQWNAADLSRAIAGLPRVAVPLSR